MVFRALWTFTVVMLLVVPAENQDKSFTIKTATTAPPKELNNSISKLLSSESVEFFDPAGTRICEIWFCKELPVDATAEQFKNGITYKELKESQVIGAVRVHQDWHDYRKQKIKPGVYTLRLGFRPEDGNHAGKSDFTEFAMLSPADIDTKPDLMSHKNLASMSNRSGDSGHALVLMLFPSPKAGKAQIECKAQDHWVINVGCEVKAGDMRGMLGFSLTVVGEAAD